MQQKFKERYGKHICEGYGMTEMAPATHCAISEACRPHSVGMPVPGVEQRIVDPKTERTMPTGTDGEIRLIHICQAYECGAVQNPVNLRKQVEGAIVMTGSSGSGGSVDVWYNSDVLERLK